jgi:hypothetical protein
MASFETRDRLVEAEVLEGWRVLGEERNDREPGVALRLAELEGQGLGRCGVSGHAL